MQGSDEGRHVVAQTIVYPMISVIHFFCCLCVCITGVHVGGCSSPFTWHFDDPMSV